MFMWMEAATLSRVLDALLFFFVVVTPGWGQTAVLQGIVTDPSGGVVPGATVSCAGTSGSIQTTTNRDGAYSFAKLAPGEYTFQASAPSLALPELVKLSLAPGMQTLNLQLKVVIGAQQVAVQADSGAGISTSAAGNATALVLRGDALNALSDDPTDLANRPVQRGRTARRPGFVRPSLYLVDLDGHSQHPEPK